MPYGLYFLNMYEIKIVNNISLLKSSTVSWREGAAATGALDLFLHPFLKAMGVKFMVAWR